MLPPESAGDVAAGDAADRRSSLDLVPNPNRDSLKVLINKSCILLHMLTRKVNLLQIICSGLGAISMFLLPNYKAHLLILYFHVLTACIV